MRRVLITGGSGFIGSHLCQSLLADGYEVHVLTRDKAKARNSLPDAVKLYQSLADMDADAPVDAVVNFAGEPLAAGRWSSQRKQRFYDSRVGTTDALYDYFVHAPQPPSVLISGSAIGYYGPHGDEQLSEQGAVVNSFSHRLCDAWELSAKRFADMGCRVCCIRTGVVLGKGEGALARMMPAFKMGLGGRLGSGKQWFSWVHIADMVELLKFCLEHNELRGPVNGTAPEPVTNLELTRQLARSLNRPAIFPMPSPVARLLFGEMAQELLLTGQRVVPTKLQKAGFEFKYPKLQDALKQIIV
ncbi:TIGR01777 family oxidoreductase [Porticoccaceae bacterium LTM1]|nr:TIGR01777 family oxidoreductase [Porticoccaceae bacterium LTM1]